MIRKLRAFLTPEANFMPGLFIFALAIRLAYVLSLPAGKLSPDAHDWMSIAWSIAQGHGFGDSWRPPGHAFFLGGIFFVFGKSVAAARVIQSLLGAFVCLLTYKTGKRLFSETAGRIAGALMAFYPYAIAQTGDLISESFFTFMIALAVYHIVKTAETPSWRNIALTGVAMGLAGLTKSTILPFFFLACAWLWWQTGKFRAGFVAGIFTLLTIMPWTLRNYYHYDKSYVMPVSTPWLTFYFSLCDGAYQQEKLGELDTPMPDDVAARVLPPDAAYMDSLPPPARDKYCRETALAWIKANPEKFSELLGRRLVHFWRLYPLMAYKWQKYAAMATSGVYIPLCFIGIILSIREFKKTSLLISMFATYSLVHMIFFSMLRYRVPLDPYVIIFAGYSISLAYSALISKLRAR